MSPLVDTSEVKEKPIIEGEVRELVEVTPQRAVAQWTPQFIAPMEQMTARRQMMLDYMERTLKKDVHYGVIPGTGTKPTLLKPGGQALMRDLGLHPEPVVLEHINDVTGADHGGEIYLAYNMRTDLYVLTDDGGRQWVGAGVGSCNSWEDRYRWRSQTRKCPECGKEAIIKGKAEYGGGWICFRKKDGCGAKFPDNAIAITGQTVGKVPNDRVMDLDNTIFKQASKRSMIEAVLSVTGASDVFTQDIEADHTDDPLEAARAEETRGAPAPAAPEKPAEPKKPMDADTVLLLKTRIKELGAAAKVKSSDSSSVDVLAWESFSAWLKIIAAGRPEGQSPYDALFADERHVYAAKKFLMIDPMAGKPTVVVAAPVKANYRPEAVKTISQVVDVVATPASTWDANDQKLVRETVKGIQKFAKDKMPHAIEVMEAFKDFMNKNNLDWTGQNGSVSLWTQPQHRAEVMKILELGDLADPAPAAKGFDPDEVPV